MFRIRIRIKRISRAPIYHTRWEHRALYKNTNNTHTHTHTHTHTRARAHVRTHARTHTHTHSASDEGIGTVVRKKYSLEIETVVSVLSLTRFQLSPAAGIIQLTELKRTKEWEKVPKPIPASL